VHGGKAYHFLYDHSYYDSPLATFSVNEGQSITNNSWSQSLKKDIFEELLSEGDKTHGIRLPQLMKWPGADGVLRITLSGAPRPRVSSLRFRVTVQGFSDPEKDRRVRVRAVRQAENGANIELPDTPILELERDDGGRSPLLLVRDKTQRLSLRACPFLGNLKLVKWRTNTKEVKATLGRDYSISVDGNQSVEAVYERVKHNE
jgi:hypothetical protein